MIRKKELGELQIAIMQVLWEQSASSAAQVHEALAQQRDLAVTTVATVLSRLEKQGLVSHEALGRVFVYRPLVSERDVRRSMVADLIDRLFAGDSAALVSHLLIDAAIEPGDLAKVKALIEQQEAKGEPEDGD